MKLFSGISRGRQKILSFLGGRQWSYLLLIGTVTVILSSKGITNESAVYLQGDMPRHMMNGIYFYDLIGDLPLQNVIDYTIHYFARYPALSLGHHPLLLAMAQVPFYAIFGISVFSARLMIIFFMLLLAIVWFLFIRSLYDEHVAFFSSLLLVTTFFIVSLSRVVMSEIPTLALIVISLYFLYLYCESKKRWYAFGFVLASVCSIYAKHSAIFMFPLYFFYFTMNMGIREVFKKDVIVYSLIITILLFPLILITYKFSQYNIAWTKAAINTGLNQSFSDQLSYYFNTAKFHLLKQISLPVMVLSLTGIIISLYKKEKNGIIFILWIISFLVISIYTGAPERRHTIYLIPAFCLLASIVINLFEYRLWKIIISIILTLIFGYQFTIAFKSETDCAYGYEEAAKYVLKNWDGDSILYSSKVDTGYFVFFLRKHTQNQNEIVLRADKILATSAMGSIIEERIRSPKEIYDILDKFGVSHVIIEDLKYESPPLEMLKEEVKSDRFIPRKRIPIQSKDHRLKNAALAIYRYKGYTKAKPDAILKMNIPLMGDSLSVKFGDLIKNSRK